LCFDVASSSGWGHISQPLPQVLTATRLKQSAAAVPGSMTVIDSELIKASGARDISELLRLVPGMMVGYTTGNQAAVNYHGTSASDARRMQVLIDGRSVYRAGLATVDWSDIPVAMEDIERIEVFRGPNTVSYGANALMAVVNILTRSPANSHGSRQGDSRRARHQRLLCQPGRGLGDRRSAPVFVRATGRRLRQRRRRRRPP
jgi:iron complex outermembrane receptor protein